MMDSITLFGVMAVLVGLSDIAIARIFAERLPPAARKALPLFGLMFIALGVASIAGIIKST
jgi:hypothetical protein